MTLLDRDPDKAMALAKELSAHLKEGATLQSSILGSPIADPMVISTLFYQVARDVIGSCKDQLAGKVLVDISNPVNATYDDLATPPGTSAADELAEIAKSNVKKQTKQWPDQNWLCLNPRPPYSDAALLRSSTSAGDAPATHRCRCSR